MEEGKWYIIENKNDSIQIMSAGMNTYEEAKELYNKMIELYKKMIESYKKTKLFNGNIWGDLFLIKIEDEIKF